MTRLANGARVVSEHLPGATTVALGIWLLGGSNDERDGEQGFAHLLEHLWFRQGYEFAARIAALGGRVNAHCGIEVSFLHAEVRPQDANAALALLWQMLALDDLTDTDIERERRLIEREHALDHDDPDSAIEHAACALAWRDRADAGVASMQSLPTADALQRYARRVLCGARIAAVAAGAIQHTTLIDGCAALNQFPAGTPPAPRAWSFTPGSFRRSGGVSEARLLWIFEACGARDPLHVVWACLDRLLNARLGRGLRDETGLAYALHTRADLFRLHGHWLLRMACAPGSADRCCEQIERILEDFAAHGADERELATVLAAQRVERELDGGNPRACLERLAHDTLISERLPARRDSDLAAIVITPALLAATFRAALPRVLRLRWLP